MEKCFNCFQEKTRDVCPHCGYDPALDAGKYPLALPHGSILAGQYVVGRVLGQGGFGITYVVLDNRTGQKVAIKEYFPDTMATRVGSHNVSAFTGQREENFSYGLQCFLSEAQVLASLMDVPHVVRVHSYFEENGTAYFVMDYVEGSSLDVYVRKRGGKLSWEEVKGLLLPVVDALAVVHSRGIIHRDVTPDNIFITEDGTVKLLDFGAARYSLGDRSRSLDVVLKHGYAPKEQYTRRGRQGPYTDVYSLGATFYYCLTGRIPPESIDRMDEDDLVMPSSFGVRIPEKAEDAIEKALAVQPADRYQSMAEFKAGLTAGEQVQERKTEDEPVHGTGAGTETWHGEEENFGAIHSTDVETETTHDIKEETKTSHNADDRRETDQGHGTGAETGTIFRDIDDEFQKNNSRDHSAEVESGRKLCVKKIRFYAAGAAAVLLLLMGGSALVKKLTKQGGNAAGSESSQEVNANGQSDETAQNEGDVSQGSGSSEDEGSQIDIDDLQIQDEEADCPWENNILMADICKTQDGSQASVFTMELTREEITSITFLDTLEDASEDAVDFSSAQDGSVLGWTVESVDGYDLYIAGEGGVMAPVDCTGLFNGYKNATYIDFGGAFHTENSEFMSYMFSTGGSLESLDLSGFDTSKVTDMSYMFYASRWPMGLDVSGLDTSNVTDMAYMFSVCIVESLDLSDLDTSNVTTMFGMFKNCSTLISLDLTDFDTSEVTSMGCMFSGCSSLESLDLNSFDTSEVTSMGCMFSGCSSLKSLKVSGFDTSNVTDMTCMFKDCSSLESLEVSGFDTSKVEYMGFMFANCPAVAIYDISGWNVSRVQAHNGFMDGSGWESLFE